MSKIRNLIVVLVLAYFAGMLGYKYTVESRLRAKLAPAYGESLAIKSVKFQDWYLQNATRTGESTFTYSTIKPIGTSADSGRGLNIQEISMTVTVAGKWWPGEVAAANTRPVAGRAPVK